MERLAFIRMLHQQAVEQSKLPEPLNFTSILAFHDAIELFFLLAAEHLNATVPEKKQFTDKFYGGINQALPSGTNLDGERGVRRLTDARNSFKHAHNWPGAQGVQQAREDAALFFQANTQKIFGVSYDEVDMADLVSHQATRENLRKASEAWEFGNRTGGMALLVDAFTSLFQGSPLAPSSRSPFTFGDNIRFALNEGEISAVLWRETHAHPPFGKGPRVPTRGPDRLAQQLFKVTEATSRMQAAMRVMSIGIDYRDQYRFDQLTPYVAYTMDGGRHVDTRDGYAPSEEDFAFCKRFVITAALRLAELETYAPTTGAL